MSPRSFEPFVGLPWRDRGRDRTGLDCWGLVCLVYRELLGIDLPSHADDYATTADRAALAKLLDGGRADWTIAAEPAAFDLVLMRERPWHVGLAIGRGQMLHMPENRTSVIEPYTTGRHGVRVEGVYRLVSRVAA